MHYPLVALTVGRTVLRHLAKSAHSEFQSYRNVMPHGPEAGSRLANWAVMCGWGVGESSNRGQYGVPPAAGTRQC